MPGENEIFSLLIEKPEKGLEKLMKEYAAFVYTIVYGKLSGVCGKQDIEECVSDIFYELYRTRESIDPEKGSIKAYIAVLSKRRAIDAFRKLQNGDNVISIDEFEHDWIASDTDVETGAADRETGELLIQAIKALGFPDSQIMIRKYYFGQGAKDIARAMGLKENTVNKKVSRALAKLEKSLGGEL